jgi:hypothetical protein
MLKEYTVYWTSETEWAVDIKAKSVKEALQIWENDDFPDDDAYVIDEGTVGCLHVQENS